MGDYGPFGFDPDEFDRVIRGGERGTARRVRADRQVPQLIRRGNGLVGNLRGLVPALASGAGDRRRGR